MKLNPSISSTLHQNGRFYYPTYLVLLREHRSGDKAYTELKKDRISKGSLLKQKGKRKADEMEDTVEQPNTAFLYNTAPEGMFDGGLREWHKEHEYLVERQGG